MNHDRIRVGGIALLFAGLCLATLVIALGGCTAAQGKTAVTIADGACEVGYVLVHLENPAIPDLCATLEELAEAEMALKAAAPASGARGAPPARPTLAEIRAEVLRRRAAKTPR